MTVPVFSHDDFIEYIKKFGWDVVETDFWDKYNRLILKKNESIYTFQCKPNGKYFYLEVVNTCKLLKIPAPYDHNHQYYLHYKKYDDNCYCESGVSFKECHGKN